MRTYTTKLVTNNETTPDTVTEHAGDKAAIAAFKHNVIPGTLEGYGEPGFQSDWELFSPEGVKLAYYGFDARTAAMTALAIVGATEVEPLSVTPYTALRTFGDGTTEASTFPPLTLTKASGYGSVSDASFTAPSESGEATLQVSDGKHTANFTVKIGTGVVPAPPIVEPVQEPLVEEPALNATGQPVTEQPVTEWGTSRIPAPPSSKLGILG